MRITKQFIIFFIFISLLSSVVMADKIIQQPRQADTATIDIIVPRQYYFDINKNFTLNFHLYNKTGAEIKATSSCKLHLYDDIGLHKVESYIPYTSSLNEFTFVVNNTLYQETGLKSYIIYCNTTNGLVGWVTGEFILNQYGHQPLEDYTPHAIIILIPVLFGLMLLFAAWQLGDDHTAIRIAFLLLAIIMPFVSFGLFSSYITTINSWSPILDTLTYHTSWMGIMVGVIITYFIIYLLYKLFHHMAQKEDERLQY